jgi:hypothetical protein
MNWKLKAGLLWLLAIPAFTGIGGHAIPGSLLPGAGYGWIGYAVVVHGVIALVLGTRAYRLASLVALAITLPVVLLGAVISFAVLFVGGWSTVQQTATVAHYVHLFLTMVTVIPLALAMVAVIPLHRLEHHLLRRAKGVKTIEKIVLMVLRVFSHIVHFVLPNIMEVIREEGVLPVKGGVGGSHRGLSLGLRQRTSGVLSMMVHVGVEAICASIRYIPLWADEISRLPGSIESGQDKNTAGSPEEDQPKDRP